MPIDERWGRFDASEWVAFAQAWLAELRGTSDADASDIGQSVVLMNFTASPDQQWQFVLAAMIQATSGDELGHIAAGPVEHLLGWHGEDYIGRVERQAKSDPQFARMLTGVRKYMMSDEIWQRVQELRA